MNKGREVLGEKKKTHESLSDERWEKVRKKEKSLTRATRSRQVSDKISRGGARYKMSS